MQRKIVQNGWQTVATMPMECKSRQYHDIFLEYLEIWS